MVAEPADIVIRGGRVYTVDDAQPWAEAVAIRGDRISWVGDEVEAAEHIGPDTDIIEGNGGSVLPGIIDSHNHVRIGGSADNSLDLHGAATLVGGPRADRGVAPRASRRHLDRGQRIVVRSDPRRRDALVGAFRRAGHGWSPGDRAHL